MKITFEIDDHSMREALLREWQKEDNSLCIDDVVLPKKGEKLCEEDISYMLKNLLDIPTDEIKMSIVYSLPVEKQKRFTPIYGTGKVLSKHETIQDKNGKEIKLEDYEANEMTGVQIGSTGHKLWVCIDGAAILRVKSPLVQMTDAREL